MNEAITEAVLAAIEAAAAKATPDPWGNVRSYEGDNEIELHFNNDDAALIELASRNALALIAEIRRLRGIVEPLQEMIEPSGTAITIQHGGHAEYLIANGNGDTLAEAPTLAEALQAAVEAGE